MKMTEEQMKKVVTLTEVVSQISKGNLYTEVVESKDRFQISIWNEKGCISLKNIWDDDGAERLSEAIKELEEDVANSIENGYGMPKPKHKPMFTVEELYIAIASENK